MKVDIKQLGLVEMDSPCSIIDLILQKKPEDLNNYCAAKIDGNVAGFVVALAGDIMTMPGLPKAPAALEIDVDDDGVISGLF